jgi:mRNA interferase RelE/StbE
MGNCKKGFRLGLSKYSVVISRKARKQIKSIPKKYQLRIMGAIDLLSINPLPPKAIKLSGRDGYRIRIGEYRIIYTFNAKQLMILVINIANRSEAYKL